MEKNLNIMVGNISKPNFYTYLKSVSLPEIVCCGFTWIGIIGGNPSSLANKLASNIANWVIIACNWSGTLPSLSFLTRSLITSLLPSINNTPFNESENIGGFDVTDITNGISAVLSLVFTLPKILTLKTTLNCCVVIGNGLSACI